MYFAALLLAASQSAPRRVGDGGEYFVMALQFASGRPPALTVAELSDVKQRLAAWPGGFESSLLEYPDLVARDGRQDFLHFFLYSLLVAPLLPLTSALGLHPNWAFTLFNALALSGALLLVGLRAPLIACVAVFVGPILWWVDKAHTEAFLFATVVVAAALFREKPSWALLAYALAGAQNAAIGVTYPFFAALVWAATRSTPPTRRAWFAAAAGAGIVALPFLYTWLRLGRLSPMAEYAQRALPSIGGLAAFIAEPNIGLLPNAPAYGVALIAGVWLLAEMFRRRPVTPIWWWPAVIQVLLLVAWTQNPNANHGGTPGVNRWVLSLLPLTLPWLVDGHRRLSGGARVAMNLSIAVAAVMSAAAHWPAWPENYREPTRLAVRAWEAGWVHVTPAEVFAERTQGREPASAPSHEGGCEILLIANQQAPVQCAPPREPLPSWCRGADAMCYAVVAEDGAARYVRAPQNGFFYRAAEPAWPAGGPLAAAVHRVLREADPSAGAWRVENPRRWREGLSGADIGVVLSRPGVSVIHILRASDSARRALADQAELQVITLLPGRAPVEETTLTNLAVIARRPGR